MVLESLGEIAPELVSFVLAEGFECPGDDGEQGDEHQLAVDGLDAEAGEQGGVLLDEDIDGDANEEWRCEVKEGAADGAEGGGKYAGSKGFGGAQEVAQGVSGVGGYWL